MTALVSKLPNVSTTIFSVMSKMAAEHNAINLSQGFPDFPVSAELIELVHKHMKAGNNQYAPMPGLLPLREQICKAIHDKHQVVVNPDTEVTITAGATEAIYAALTAIVQRGDEVILFNPAYDCYEPAIHLNGGIPVHLSLKQPDFSIDWEEVQNTITANTRAIIINSPHNPTGTVLSKEDLLKLERIAVKNNLIVISDEVYEHIIFDQKHQSALLFEELRNRCVAVYSFGKTFHVTGWKCGYAIAPKGLTKEIRKIHQYLVFSVTTPMQYAISEYLETPDHYNHIHELYQKKRDLFQQIIKESRFELVPCEGTYFQLLSYKNISDINDIEMAEKLTKEHKIASIPISVFYKNKQDDKLLRFCFAKNESTLKQAGEILCKI